MARNFIAAVLLLAAIAGINAQTPTAPVMDTTTTTMPQVMVPSAGPTVPVAAPVAAMPVAAAPVPSKPAFDPNLVVKPEEVKATIAFLDSVYKANPNVQTACVADKIVVSTLNIIFVIPTILQLLKNKTFLSSDPAHLLFNSLNNLHRLITMHSVSSTATVPNLWLPLAFPSLRAPKHAKLASIWLALTALLL